MKNVLVRRIYELGPPAIVEAGRRAISSRLAGRLGILVQIASLAATGWITWITTIHPRLDRLTLSRLLGDALLYALLACTWSAAIALALYLLLPKSESRNMLWAVLRTSAVAVWFAPATILLSHVAPAALAASLALVVTATRLLYSEWLAASPPVEEPWTRSRMFGENLPPAPAITRELGTGLAAACVLQLAVLAALMQAPLACGRALRPDGRDSDDVRHHGRSGERRAANGPCRGRFSGSCSRFCWRQGSQWAGCTAGWCAAARGRVRDGNTPGRRGSKPGAAEDARELMRDLLYGKKDGRAGTPISKPPLPPQSRPRMWATAVFRAWSCGPRSSRSRGWWRPYRCAAARGSAFASVQHSRLAASIGCSGVLLRPPPNSFFQRGSPAALAFSTTDHWPLEMEAHQKLEEPLDLSCCRAVRVDIWNADRYPGTVALELFAIDGERSTSLG